MMDKKAQFLYFVNNCSLSGLRLCNISFGHFGRTWIMSHVYLRVSSGFSGDSVTGLVRLACLRLGIGIVVQSLEWLLFMHTELLLLTYLFVQQFDNKVICKKQCVFIATTECATTITGLPQSNFFRSRQ